RAVVPGGPAPRPFALAAGALPAHWPGGLEALGDRLGRHRLAEAGEAAARVHGDAAAERRRAVADQLLGIPRLAQADVLVPVELERRGEVVDLRQVEVLGTQTGLLVGAARDRVAERRVRRAHPHGPAPPQVPRP